MELKEFIKTVLVDICEAIVEAQDAVKESAIAPAAINGIQVEREQMIDFEISVTASDSVEGRGEGKIKVISLGASMEGTVSQETQSTNKISFQVPVYYSAKFNNR